MATGGKRYGARAEAGVIFTLNSITIIVEMNVKKIKDEIRKLSPADKLEIYRWIDDQAHSAELLSGIGVYRWSAVRQGIGKKFRVIN